MTPTPTTPPGPPGPLSDPFAAPSAGPARPAKLAERAVVRDIIARHVTPGTVPDEARDWHLPGEDGYDVTIHARLLGVASSERDDHTHEGDRPEPGWKCSACRWLEVRILVTTDRPPVYVVHTVGRTIVDGETERVTISETTSPLEVVEILTLRRRGQVFLPGPAARALSQAAYRDEELRQAYVDRAVA